MTALRFWVGTPYRLRWRRADDDALPARLWTTEARARAAAAREAARVTVEQSRTHRRASQVLRGQARAARTAAALHAGRQP